MVVLIRFLYDDGSLDPPHLRARCSPSAPALSSERSCHLPEVQRHYRGDYDIGAAQKANAPDQRLSPQHHYFTRVLLT